MNRRDILIIIIQYYYLNVFILNNQANCKKKISELSYIKYLFNFFFRKGVLYNKTARSINQPNSSRNSEKTPLLGRQPSVTFKGGKQEEKENKASLFKVMAKVYGPAMLRAWGCKFMYDLLQFTSPILLR